MHGPKEQHVRLVVDVPLPHLVRESLLDKGTKLLSRHGHRFDSAVLHIHVKPSGSAVECGANLFTDAGSFHASVEEWNILRGIDDVLETLHMQILKKAEKRVVIRT